MTAPTVTQIEEGVYSIVAPCEADFDVRALLVTSGASSILIDSLARPADLEVLHSVRGSAPAPDLIVNTHADWDHWLGNAAFPDASVLALDLTLERQRRNGKRTLSNLRRRSPDYFARVELRAATTTYRENLRLSLGRLTIELHHLPGHTPDSTLAYIPELKLLFAADCAEEPFPVVGAPHVLDWASALESWAEVSDIVVPSHGAIGGPDLLLANARYLRNLLDPSSSDRPVPAHVNPFYRRTHRENLRRVRRLA